ncbi:hypothetical protein WDZ92_02645 [Nostoc sp. NIES-2111]
MSQAAKATTGEKQEATYATHFQGATALPDSPKLRAARRLQLG